MKNSCGQIEKKCKCTFHKVANPKRQQTYENKLKFTSNQENANQNNNETPFYLIERLTLKRAIISIVDGD